MATFHVELRKFPRTLTRFNQTGQQIGAIVLPWVQDRIVEIDGDKWAPYESTISIVEGPPIPLSGISMGRGWRTAQREGTDVTERVLTEARQALADSRATTQPLGAAPSSSPSDAGAGEDRSRERTALEPGAAPVGVEEVPAAADAGLDDLLGPDSRALLLAWRAIVARTVGLRPSESLALAERELQRDETPGG